MINQALKALFLLLIFSLPLVQFFASGLNGIIVQATDYIFIGCALMWAIAIFSRQQTIRWSPLYLPMALYLTALFVSLFFSTRPQTSLFVFFGEIYLVGLAVLTINLTRDFADFRRVCLIWLAATGVTIAFSLLSLFWFYFGGSSKWLAFTLSHYGTLPPGNYPRIQSTFFNPNMLCTYLTVSFAILFLCRHFNWLSARLFWGALALLSVAAFFTLSPGIGGILLLCGSWLWLRFKQQNRKSLARLSLSSAAAVAFLFFIITLVSPIRTGTAPYVLKIPVVNLELEPSSRLLAWQTSFETFIQRPVFGRGLGADVANVRYLNPSGRLEHLTDAHQTWLNVAGQTGLAGLSALVFLSVFLVRRGLPFNLDNTETALRSGFWLAFCATFLYQGLTGSYEEARHLWVLIGLLESAAIYAETS